MKIALFSDIHANLPALEAFFKDVETHNADAIYCLGDLVGYNIWPNEVINEIRSRKIPTLFGNYDLGIGQNGNDCGCAYKTDEDKAMGAVSIAYTNQIIGESERAYLRTLPAHIRLDYRFNDEKISLLLVHGSPRKVNEYLFEDREENSLRRIMEQSDAHIMCFGHTHQPWHRVIKSDDQQHRHAVNLGSVGKPKDGSPLGCYVLLEMDEKSSLKHPESIRVEFIRFQYDVEKAAKAVENSPLPDDYAEMLRRG